MYIKLVSTTREGGDTAIAEINSSTAVTAELKPANIQYYYNAFDTVRKEFNIAALTDGKLGTTDTLTELIGNGESLVIRYPEGAKVYGIEFVNGINNDGEMSNNITCPVDVMISNDYSSWEKVAELNTDDGIRAEKEGGLDRYSIDFGGKPARYIRLWWKARENDRPATTYSEFRTFTEQEPTIEYTDADAVKDAKNAVVDGSVDVAFGATQEEKTTAVQTYVNGLVTNGVTATVSYKEGNVYTVKFVKGQATDSKEITMTINVAADPDIAIVDAELAKVNELTFNDITAKTEEAIKTAIEGKIAKVEGVTYTVNKVSFTAAVDGNADKPQATNGSYVFKITVSKGAQTKTTEEKSITINGTDFEGETTEQLNAAKTAAKAALDGVYNAIKKE